MLFFQDVAIMLQERDIVVTMKKLSKKILLILFFSLFLFSKPNVYEISTDIHSLQSANQGKTILLVAAHGSGKDCNHAQTTIDGVTYYENIEAREMIDGIANYFDAHDIKYEIANEIVGDYYWSDNSLNRKIARNCTNPNDGQCCGFRTATIGNYANVLAAHVDSKGGSEYYSMVFELHFNAGRGSYSLMLGRDNTLKAKGLPVAQAVMKTINEDSSKAIYAIDEDFLQRSLGTFTIYYEQRKIPTYYLETIFMDNDGQFRTYLKNKNKMVENIAKQLISISPSSVGNGGNQSSNLGDIGGSLDKLKYDPFSEYYLSLNKIGDSKISCKNLFLKNDNELNDLGLFMQDLYLLIKISAIVLFIILSTIDLLKYLVNDENKKNIIPNILKRLILALLIFFLPDIIDLLFHLFGLYDLSNCTNI